MSAVASTERFLDAIFAGQIDQALAMVAPQARFIGSRPTPSADNPLFGTHIGQEGARAFFAAFGTIIEPGAFTVTGKFGAQDQACLYGQFSHTIKATGRPFLSDWALVTQFDRNQLVLYHFYEDTAALAEAMGKA